MVVAGRVILRAHVVILRAHRVILWAVVEVPLHMALGPNKVP